jgi:hypothetical protein
MKAKSVNLALAGILAAGFALRLWGINFGLPHLYHADEPIVVNHALAYGTGDMNPHFFNIPPLVSYLLFIVYGFYYVAGKLAGGFHSPADFEQLFYGDPASFYLIARFLFGVLCGTAGIFALHRVASRHLTKQEALTSSLFFALCFLHVTDSHYVYADIPLVAVMILAMGAIFAAADHHGRVREHVLAGALIGLACAVKYNGIFLLVPYFYITGCFTPRSRWPACAGAALGAAALVFFLLNPFALLDGRFFLSEMREQSLSNTGTGPWHHFFYSLAGGMGWPVLLLAFYGGLSVFFEEQHALTWLPRMKRRAVFIFTAAYYAVLALKGQPYSRYALPLTPFICLLAASGVRKLFAAFPAGRHAWLCAAVLAAAVFHPLRMDLRWDLLMSRPDTRTLAGEWIEKNLAPGSKIALDVKFYAPPLRFSRAQLEEKKQGLDGRLHGDAQARRLDFLIRREQEQPGGFELYFLSRKPGQESPFLFWSPLVPYDLSELRAKGIEYVLLAGTRPPAWTEVFFDDLQKNATLVHAWSPYDDPALMTALDPRPLTGGPFLPRDVLRRKRNGQPLALYQIKKAP